MKTNILAVGITVLVTLLVVGCKGEPPAPPKKEVQDVNSITLRPELTERIIIGEPMMVSLADKLQAPSRVEVDEERLVRIGSFVTGRITDLYVKLGDTVKVGDPLARITSTDLTQAQLAYLRAYSRTILTEKSADRAHQLRAADVLPMAEVERRVSEFEVARAELEAAKDQLRLLGVGGEVLKELTKQGHILPSIAIKATRDGIIIDRSVVVGQVVQPSDKLFELADLSSVWVVGDVPEQIARDVRVGQHVEIHVPALGDEMSFDGLIIFVADTLNPLTRTVMVRTMVENSSRKLKPDMLATMHIVDNPTKSLVVPISAVVREANRDYVFLSQGNNQFLRIPVELGPEVADMRPVVKGVSLGQKIVVDGAFHLDNERKLAELE
ncbi:MAG: efflux RND transporter periplasmic adaptor subunit [Nitrosomonadaceae bacterium]